MQSYPKISIIIHCFNREKYIRETLNSVLDQKYPNLELIVIDDGSTDKSWEIITSYADKIAWIEKLPGKRSSPVFALNTGFKKATGEVIMWLNTKNILLNKSLFVVGEVFEQLPEVEWLTGLGCMIDDRGLILRVLSLYRNKYDYMAGRWEVIQQESTCWRRSLWERTGGSMDADFDWAFDIALWVKFFKVTPLYQINTIIGAYRETAKSQSVKNRSVFLSHTKSALEKIWHQATLKERISYYFYSILHTCRLMVRAIPDNFFARMPLLKRFSALTVRYKESDGVWNLKIFKANPFNKL